MDLGRTTALPVCDYISHVTEQHLAMCEAHDLPTWRTLYTYTKMDLPCVEISLVYNLVLRIMAMIHEMIGELYGAVEEARKLAPRSWKEPHMLRYQVVESSNDDDNEESSSHVGAPIHYDGSHFTWQLMLSDLDEYEGES